MHFNRNMAAMIVAGLVAGGTLAAYSTPIGQFTLPGGIVPGVTATSLGKAEDTPHTSGDVGVAAFAERQDTMAADAGTTGDYTMLHEDSLGRVRAVNQLSAGDGATPKSDLGATNTGTTPLTAAAVLVGSIQACNGDSATNVVKLYDKATAATSSDTPVARIVVAAGACNALTTGPTGLKLANGLSVRATTEKTDAGTTGAAASTVTVNFSYF